MVSIAGSIIVGKNDIDFIDQCLPNVAKLVDKIYIVADSNDIDLLNKLEVYTDCVYYREWTCDFAAQRNYCLEKVDRKYDFLFWCDIDDYIPNPKLLRNKITAAINSDPTISSIYTPYVFNSDENGNPVLSTMRNSFVKLSLNPKWVGKYHEYLSIENDRPITIDLPIIHKGYNKTREKDRSDKIIEILKSEWDTKNDLRALFYYARELYYRSNIEESKCALKDFIRLSKSNEYKMWANIFLGDIEVDIAKKEYYYKQAVKECPHFAEPYFKLGELKYNEGNYVEALSWFKSCLTITKPNDFVFRHDDIYDYKVYDYLSIIYWELGDKKSAEKYAKEVLKYKPNDERIINNIKIFKGNTTKKGTLVFYTSLHGSPWNRNTIDEEGIGGRETSNAYMAEELSKLGWDVNIITNCEGKEGLFNGVNYIHHKDVLKKISDIKPDILFISGENWILDNELASDNIVLWSHDIGYGDESCIQFLSESRALSVDWFFMMSQIQLSTLLKYYPYIPKHRTYLTRSGIKLDRFKNKNLTKDKHKCIYSSCPTRGLEYLLESIWPSIVSKVPEAKLHIYYGFDNFDKTIMYDDKNRERNIKWKEKMIRLIQDTPNVVYHGRVPQDQLAEEMLTASVWLYPTWFYETMCLTALETMAAGCVPVASNLGALTTTIDDGGILIDANCNNYKEEFINYAVKLLTDDQYFLEMSEKAKNQVFNKRWDWKDIAEEWDKKLIEIIDYKKSLHYIEECNILLSRDNPTLSKEIIKKAPYTPLTELISWALEKRTSHQDSSEKSKTFYNKVGKKSVFCEDISNSPKDLVIKSRLQSNDRILDLGCNNGDTTIKAADYCKDITAVDISETALSRLKQELEIRGITNVTIKQLDIRQTLPFNDNEFDVVILFDVLEHLENWQTTLKEAIRVSKREVLVSVPQGPHESLKETMEERKNQGISDYYQHLNELDFDIINNLCYNCIVKLIKHLDLGYGRSLQFISIQKEIY